VTLATAITLVKSHLHSKGNRTIDVIKKFHYLGSHKLNKPMDVDSSTLVYIVAVIVYFLYTTFFRKKEPRLGPDEEVDQRKAEPRKAVSFEDLLKNIRNEQKERERELEGVGQEEDEFEIPEPSPIKTVTTDEPEKYQKPRYYEENQGNVRNYETQPLVKLDDQVDLEAADRILGKVEDVAKDYPQSNKYAALLKNPDTVREAIVVSEILQRRHF
jgi:hypothetical protein